MDKKLWVKCNAGTSVSNKKGYWGHFHMWLVCNGIANLLFVPQLECNGCKLTYSTDSTWQLETPKGQYFKFKCDTGVCDHFPLIDMRENDAAVALVTMVRQRYKGYTKRQVKDAANVRRAQAMVGCSPDRVFKKSARNRKIKNNPVTVEQLTNTENIFGPNRARLQGASR